MQDFLINVEKGILLQPEFRFKNPVNWKLAPNEHWAIIGPNGAGKSVFSSLLTGKIPLKEGSITYHLEEGKPLYEQIRSATFQDIYSLADYKNMYYQQRWNSAGEEDAPLIRDLVCSLADEQTIREMFALFDIEKLLDKRLILLSSGELRKFLIVRMLLSNPKILILDNPYIGLDAASRDLLNNLFVQLSEQKSVQIILILSNPADIPELITHVQPVCDRELFPPLSRIDFVRNIAFEDSLFPPASSAIKLPDSKSASADYDSVLMMQDICIKYGQRTILNNLNWTVKKGEKWVLSGPNGAGKSTLLSLVCADNPQSYANTFYIFGKKRGSGESIWDIKKQIGYVSPEIHLYYQQNQPCINVIGSGFFDSIGLHRKCTEDQLQTAREWMAVFGIEHLSDKPFLKLSFGEQRLAILARAFVKDPKLLILDEPLHGLDKSKRILVSMIIEEFCKRPDKTLIYVTHYVSEIPSCVTKHFELKYNF